MKTHFRRFGVGLLAVVILGVVGAAMQWVSGAFWVWSETWPFSRGQAVAGLGIVVLVYLVGWYITLEADDALWPSVSERKAR